MFWNRTTVQVANHDVSPSHFVTAIVQRSSEETSSQDLVRAFDAARALAADARSDERDRWVSAADQVFLWLAVRCVCSDPVAMSFFNDRDQRPSMWSAA